MLRYLVFPVKVDSENNTVASRPGGEKAGYFCNAANYEDAHSQGSTHVPLFEGEQLAVVVIGKANVIA